MLVFPGGGELQSGGRAMVNKWEEWEGELREESGLMWGGGSAGARGKEERRGDRGCEWSRLWCWRR